MTMLFSMKTGLSQYDRDESQSDQDGNDALRAKKTKDDKSENPSKGPTLKRTEEDFNFKQKLQKRTKYLMNEITTGMKVEQ